ncbi:MAG TPA: FKBP-type peptidyl-prolyl cis-trans isomerase [Myxococcaceae bacterium]|nr:FKBP-type peptidyl-prolyl cis-trans isomerase [Myxococcaceae bacterium]
MRAALVTAVAVAVFLAPACKGGGKASAGPPVSEDDKTLYALGVSIGQNLRVFALTDQELAMVERGMEDQVMHRKVEVELREYGPKLSQLARTRGTKASEDEKKKGAAYAAEQEKQPGAQKLPSGVIYIEQQAGAGEQPTPTSVVKVQYRGTLLDGTEFDSSYKRNAPAEFPLNGVVRCWTEGLQKMKVGGKAKLVCPSDVAYGDRGGPGGIPGGATLTFEVELLEVKATPPPPAMPNGMPGGPPGGPPGAPPTPGGVSKAPPPAQPVKPPPPPPAPKPESKPAPK